MFATLNLQSAVRLPYGWLCRFFDDVVVKVEVRKLDSTLTHKVLRRVG